MLLFPSFAGKIDADEMLVELLDENRDDPILKNIISTLQQQQFTIIEADTNQSFIVQGCAGSGKSQCIFHRLFFLRDELSDKGWDKVVLITGAAGFIGAALSMKLIKIQHLGATQAQIVVKTRNLASGSEPSTQKEQLTRTPANGISRKFLMRKQLSSLKSSNSSRTMTSWLQRTMHSVLKFWQL